ncbi:MAG: FkbM family methyltransferase [Sedimenticola sp.]
MTNRIKEAIKAVFKVPLRVSPRLNFLYTVHRRNRNLFRAPVQTPYGFNLCGNKGMESGDFEQEEVKKIQSKLETVDLFINIGSNIGYYACIAAAMGKQVIAFEPDSANCNLLYKNIHINGFDELIEVFPVALADRVGILELFGLGTGASIVNIWDVKEDGVLIPVNALDSILAHRLTGLRCLFLMDVEGAEHLVLRGAGQCLEADAEWIIEITAPEHKGNSLAGKNRFKDVFDLFDAKGLKPFLLSDGLPITPKEIDEAEQGKCIRLSKESMFSFSRDLPP